MYDVLEYICWQIDNIHRSGCMSLDVSQDGRYLVTAGDKVVKVWDYHMRLDLNFQVSSLIYLHCGHKILVHFLTSCSFLSLLNWQIHSEASS